MNVSKLSSTFVVCSCGAILAYLSFLILNFLYNEQRTAFIDEIFHVPQAQSYCNDRWTEWNPKITTLPGLYVVSCLILKPFNFFGERFYSVYTLRLTNLIPICMNFILTYKISCALERKYKVKSSRILKLLTALNVTIFPPLYFFTFLYYTDAWSVTFVLMTYYVHLSEGEFSKFAAFFAGFMAVLMRQTNIIWIGLMIIDDFWSVLVSNTKTVAVQDYKFTKKILQKFISDLNFGNVFRKFDYVITNTILRSCHNISICVIFVIFVLINKGIVLGDKQAHSVTFHPMQNLYFLDFAAFFAFPFLILECFSLWRKPPNAFLMLVFAGACALLSDVNKLEHPYLLADNRHIAFYLWKRIFGHSQIRRLLVPSYVSSALLLWRHIQKRCNFMFMVALSFCIFLNLTPQYLFELRYYIVPFLMCRLQFKQTYFVILESVFFIIINSAVIYLFINYPFVWPSEPNATQRFIW